MSRPLNTEAEKPSLSSSTLHIVMATSAFSRLVPHGELRDLFPFVGSKLNHCLLNFHIMDKHSALLQKRSHNVSMSTNYELH